MSCKTKDTELPVVSIVQADSMLGKATVNALSSLYGQKLDIRAHVKDPEKFTAFQSKPGVSVIQSDLSEPKLLQEALKGSKVLCIAPPRRKDRAEITTDLAKSAKKAGVQYIVLYSSVTAETTDTIFGKQFQEIEKAIMKLGVSYTILRLPLYMDNYGDGLDMKNHTFSAPVDPTKIYTPVATGDVVRAAAEVLVIPEKHAGRTYTIASDRHTFGDLTQALTELLGQKLEYIRVPYDELKRSYVEEHRFPEWQAEGIMEMYRLVDSGSPLTNQENIDDFTKITGEQPTNLLNWVKAHSSYFK